MDDIEYQKSINNRMIMPPKNGVAYRLAAQIIHSLPKDMQVSVEWQRGVLEACEAALGCQDQMIAELRRLLSDVKAVNPEPIFISANYR